jgi:hypothetical protein
VATELSVSIGSSTVTVPLTPGQVASFTVPASGTPGWRDYNYLMRARTSSGFVPRLLDPKSTDNRYLGANMRFSPMR